MKAFQLTCLGMVALLPAACVSPAEQRAMDEQRCAGFGFAPGTDAMANCLMGVTQQREAEQAAQQRENARDRAMSEQRDRDRAEAERARDDAASQQRRDDFMRDFNRPVATGFSMPSMSSSNCSVVSAANAGSMTCR